jgi:2-dehydro-3-deoxyglucarate aldolase/4-hydroxy-2-oxoheptanedioate aldolase
VSKAIKKFRHKLKSGQRCLGPGISFSDPAVTEALGETADFVWIDLEHCPIGRESLQAHLIAARATGTAALVRVAGSDEARIKPVLDIGADGVIVPQVRSAAEVRGVVAACRYPPLGQRGFGPRRAANYGRDSVEQFIRAANEDVFVAVQVENVEALGQLDAIVAIPGLDSIVVGPADLSGSMGKLGQLRDLEVEGAVRRIVTTARAAGLSVGIGMGPDEEYARWVLEIGVQWVQCGGDFSYMVSYADRLYERLRSQVSS